VANKGLVGLGKREKGKTLLLKSQKKMVCPYLADIGIDTGGHYCLPFRHHFHLRALQSNLS
jgi:hypothetical protein